MPVDYSRGKIYKIVDLDTDDCYIGSTCEPTLARRLAGHVRNFRKYKNGKATFTTSFKIIENDNYDVQLIEEFPCENKMQLHAREGYWIKNTDCINKIIPCRTQKQYYEDNKEKMSEWYKQYRIDNKEKISKREKEYYKNNKDKINKKVECPCGGIYTSTHKARHEKTSRHINFKIN